MIDAGRPASRLVTRSKETTPEKKVVADPTGPTELVVDIDLPDDESMDERIKVDDTGVKVARTSPWLSRKRKVAAGAEGSGETEEDEPQERTEEGNEPPRKRSPAKHAATERQVLAAPTGSSATMTSTTSAPARGLPAKRPPSAPPDKENVANARVPANAEPRPEVKHGAAAGVPTPAAAAAAAAAPRGERTSPTKVMKQTSLFSVGITPSRGTLLLLLLSPFISKLCCLRCVADGPPQVDERALSPLRRNWAARDRARIKAQRRSGADGSRSTMSLTRSRPTRSLCPTDSSRSWTTM
jgi:hypothetical protein